MLDLSNAIPTLNEEFKTRPEWRKGAGIWSQKAVPLQSSPRPLTPGYVWDQGVHRPIGNWNGKPWPRLPDNHPAWTSNVNVGDHVCPNGDMLKAIGESLGPFAWSPGVMTLKAMKMPAYLARTVGPADPKLYMGGALVSCPFSQQYGVFSIVCKAPKGKGLWPAFWLLPNDDSPETEIDVMEILGQDPKTLHTTLHMRGTDGKHYMDGRAWTPGIDFSASYNEFSVDWGPETITWYLNGKPLWTRPSLVQMQKPFYLLVDLGVGRKGSWAGPPDANTVFPAEFKVRSIKAWQRPEYLR